MCAKEYDVQKLVTVTLLSRLHTRHSTRTYSIAPDLFVKKAFLHHRNWFKLAELYSQLVEETFSSILTRKMQASNASSFAILLHMQIFKLIQLTTLT